MTSDESRPPQTAEAGHGRRDLGHTIFVKLPRVLIAVLILAGITINFANVVSRHLFSSAIFWAEEILVFLVIWIVSIAVVAVTYQGAHLRMDLFATNIASPWKNIINALTALLFMGFCALVVVQSFAVVSAFSRTGTVSITASVPMVIPHSALLIGFTLMVLAVLFRLRAYLRGSFDDD